MKKTVLILLSALCALSLFAGCGAAAADAEADKQFESPGDRYNYYDTEDEAFGSGSESWTSPETGVSPDSSEKNYTNQSSLQLGQPDPNRKLVYRINYELETKNFDDSVAALISLAQSLGGYTESSNTTGGNGSERRANYVLRIPSEKLQDFIASAGTVGSIISEELTTDDVTLEYVDVESRLNSLRAQETRLLELLKEADNLSDVLLIEESLSEVRYEVESYTTQLNKMESLVSYSTVSVRLYEVIEYTPVVSTPLTFGEKLSRQFSESVQRVWNGIQNCCIWFLGNIVEIVLVLALIAAVVIVHIAVIKLIIRRCRKNKSASSVN